MQSGKSKDTGFITALYCRVSREDIKEGDRDSNSIATQKLMLGNYAKEHGFSNTRYYVDDGYTGTNFNRPDFKRMINDCENGLIKTIIVKDLSRLGRTHLEVGVYTEEYFPDAGIRFIAVTDMFDTEAEENEIAPFKNILNEMYAKDISRKCRASAKARGNTGIPLSTQPPYGYIKDSENKHYWVVDEEAANVVREIFRMFLEGKGQETIARELQERKILVPTEYFRAKGIKRSGNRTEENPYKWCKSTVVKILKQREYCGDVVNFKTYSKSFKKKKRISVPEKDWKIFEGVHEPIIDRETFLSVQKICGKRRHKPPKETKRSIYSDLMFCADCKSPMWHHIRHGKTEQKFFSCSNYKGNRGTCEKTHNIREDALDIIIRKEIESLIDFVKDNEAEFVRLLEKSEGKKELQKRKQIESEIRKAQSRADELPNCYKALFEKNISGVIDDEHFNILTREYDIEQAELKGKIESLTDELRKSKDEALAKERFLKAVHNVMKTENITASVLRELIDRIEVFAVEGTGKNRTQRIVIHYNFIGAFEFPSNEKKPFSLETRQGVLVNYLTKEKTA